MKLTFKQWMKRVDRLLESALGLSSMDLSDKCWRDMFDDGITPREAAADIISDPWSHI